jgi:hypothetical protein
MTTRKRFASEEEERDYWDKTDVETLNPKPRRAGWKTSMLYLSEKDARGLVALAELEGEPQAAIIRRALRELGAKLARQHDTTWAELTKEPGAKTKKSAA